MPSLEEFWNKNEIARERARQQRYLNSGAYNGYVGEGVPQQCTDSSQCASGFKCAGGFCVKGEDYGAGIFDGQGCGSGSGGSNGGGGECSGGTELVTLYGDPEFVDFYTDLREQGDYFSASGFVKNGLGKVTIRDATGACIYEGCGGFGTRPGPDGSCCNGGSASTNGGTASCPPPPSPPSECSKQCTSYFQSTGELAENCTDQVTCKECEDCVSVLGGADQCVPTDGPCYCDAAAPCGACELCGENGECAASTENCVTCYDCAITCPNGQTSSARYCGSDASFTGCRAYAAEQCPDPPSDPCAGDCTTVTTYDGDPIPPCPAGKVCRESGFIQVGGSSATLTEQCDFSGLPDDCFPCDCNCDNDCGDCEICSAAGVCVPDPACDCGEISTYFFEITRDAYSVAQPNCSRPNNCGDMGFNPAAVIGPIGLNAKGPLSVSYSPSGPVYVPSGCDGTPNGEYVMGSLLIVITDCEGNTAYQTTLQGPLACAGDTQITGSVSFL